MPTDPQPDQPVPVPKPDIVRPPTPLEEPQPEKRPELPLPGPDVVLPPGPDVGAPPSPQEIPSTPPA
jgi:D-alanyl-D-alanine carboxypeptidase (penicillin-binding protein 5/6)